MLSPALRSLRASMAADRRHALHDPVESTRAAREAAATALDKLLLLEIDPDGTLPKNERAKRLVRARRAHFKQLAYRRLAKRLKGALNGVDKEEATPAGTEMASEKEDGDARAELP